MRARLQAVPSRRLCFAIGVCLCLAADFSLARVLYPNSDSVQSYNEMLAVRSGDVLLRHWVLATDNFLLTDLPPMMIASLVLGPADRLIFVVPFLTFAMMLTASFLIIRGVVEDRPSRLAACCGMLLLIGVPYSLYYNFFFWSDFHVATITACLYAILAVTPALSGFPFNRWRLLPFILLVFVAAFSDPMADGLLLLPILFLAGLRGWLGRSFRVDDWLIVLSAIAGLVASLVVLKVLAATGWSFSILPSVSLGFVPDADAVVQDFRALLGGEQVLFAARASLMSNLPLHDPIAVSRQATAVLVAVLCVSVVWRMPRTPRSGVAQLLVIGAACVAILASVSSTFHAAVGTGPDFPGAAVRFAVPSFVFASIAAALELGDLVAHPGRRRRRWLLATGISLAALYAVGGVAAVFRAVASAPGIEKCTDARLARWLRDNHYRYGVGDYWDTQLVDALTDGAVLADPVVNIDGHLMLSGWLTDVGRFRPENPPQFAIIRPHGLFRIDLASVTATYGLPLSITKVADFFLVAKLRTGTVPERRLP